jgi:hypothetical protein
MNVTEKTGPLIAAKVVTEDIKEMVAMSKKSQTRSFNIIELLGEVFTSGFVGLGVFMAANAMEQPLGLCAAAAGVGGHMATRLLFAIEKILESKINKLQ